jgi:type IV secretory pathway VirB2 component (pilin)
LAVLIVAQRLHKYNSKFMNTGKYLEHNQTKLISFWVFALAAFMCFPSMAFAVDSQIAYVMCRAALLVTGQPASALATIGICILGAGAAFGKISWHMVIIVGAGISGIFGAYWIAETLAGRSLANCA